MTKKKPWNRINLPVYSISSKAGERHNMNIITYITQVSMQPKRFVCCIYQGTQTLLNVEKSGEFVLQLLAVQQHRLVSLLGKQSGKTIDKTGRLKKRNELAMWNDFYVLKNALAVLQLKVINSFDGGDHKGFICDVAAYKNLHEGIALTLDDLRKYHLIRI